MATDFFDEDLAESVSDADGYSAAPPQPSRQENPTAESYHAKCKREIPEAQAVTEDEIQRLLMRKQELEKRKQELADQRHRISLLERNRSDLLDKLRRNSVLVVRQGEQASRAAAVCSEAGANFSRLHQDIEGINPNSWDKSSYEANLIDAIAKVDSAAAEYRATMDRVAAVDLRVPAGPSPEGADFDTRPGRMGARGFAYWLVAGFAFTLPLAALLVLLALVFHKSVM